MLENIKIQILFSSFVDQGKIGNNPIVSNKEWNHLPISSSGSVPPQLIVENGYETHCSLFLFPFFNRDPAQNKNIPVYIGQ